MISKILNMELLIIIYTNQLFKLYYIKFMKMKYLKNKNLMKKELINSKKLKLILEIN